MRRRTLISVSFAVALHVAAFLSLDHFRFVAATHRRPVNGLIQVELVPDLLEPVAKPAPLVEAVPPPPVTLLVEPEKPSAPGSEMNIGPKPEPSSEATSASLLQTKTVILPFKTVAAVAPALTVASASSNSTNAPVNAGALNSTLNSPSLAIDGPHSLPVLTQAVYLGKPRLAYPATARLKKQEGVVLLAVEVSAEGRPLRVEVEISSGFEALDESAVTNVRRSFRFKPAQLDGVPVATRVQVPVRFQLKD